MSSIKPTMQDWAPEELDGVGEEEIPKKKKELSFDIPHIEDEEMKEHYHGLCRRLLTAKNKNAKVWLSFDYDFNRKGWQKEEGILFQIRWPILYLDKKINGEWRTFNRSMHRIDWDTYDYKYVKADDVGYPKHKKPFQPIEKQSKAV